MLDSEWAVVQEYIDLEIDNFRNNLIRVSLQQQYQFCCMYSVLTRGVRRLQTRMILDAGNFALAMVFAVVSIWGVNLSDKHTDSYALFVVVCMVVCLYLGVPDIG